MPISDQRLIASAVYNQQRVYIGTVVKVNRDPAGTFSLVVQQAESHAATDKLWMDGASIRHIDAEHKKIYVDLEEYPPQPVLVEALPLWQEKLIVNQKRRKTGEISIRKVTETHTVSVPIRSEKLVVESVDTENVLAEVDLSKYRVDQTAFSDAAMTDMESRIVRGYVSNLEDAISLLSVLKQDPDNGFEQGKVILTLRQGEQTETVSQTFESVDTSLQILTNLVRSIADRCDAVYLELLVANQERAKTYQNWLRHYSQASSNFQNSTSRVSARS